MKNKYDVINNDLLLKTHLKYALIKKNYRFFEKVPYDMNMIAVRNNVDRRSSNSNHFNDKLFLVYMNNLMEWEVKIFNMTTDPGLYYRKNTINPKGVAILKPNQYRSAYKFGKHKGRDALIQNKEITVYRDNDNNADISNINKLKTDTGFFGINIHSTGRAEQVFMNIDKWSAGCQVFGSQVDFDYFLNILKQQKLSNTFTYTLITTDDL